MKNIQLISNKVTFIAFSIVLFIYQQEIKAQTEDTSILGKVLTGYQGWFNSDSDGSGLDWKHYKTAVGNFEPGECSW